MYNNLSKSRRGGPFVFEVGYHTSPGGTYLEKWYGLRGCAALKTHFSRSLSSSLRPPFQQKLQFFTNFAVLDPKFTKKSVPKPQILQNFSSKASMILAQNSVPYKPLFFPKNQFFQPLFFVPGRSLSPHLRSKFGGGGALVFEVGYHPR